MSLPSAVESGWILGKHTRQLHESHSRNTKTSKGKVPCYITKDGTIEGHFFWGWMERIWVQLICIPSFPGHWIHQIPSKVPVECTLQASRLKKSADFRTIVKSEIFPT